MEGLFRDTGVVHHLGEKSVAEPGGWGRGLRAGEEAQCGGSMYYCVLFELSLTEVVPELCFLEWPLLAAHCFSL